MNTQDRWFLKSNDFLTLLAAERDREAPSVAFDSTDAVRIASGCSPCVTVDSVDVFLGAASLVGR